MKKLLFWLLSAAALAAFWSCDFGPSSGGDAKHYVSLRVADSLKNFETLEIRLVTSKGDTLEVWKDSLSDVGQLVKVDVPDYDGGDADIILIGTKGGKIAYIRIIHYTSSQTDPKIDTPSLPDYAPPVLTLNESDELEIPLGDSSRINPSVYCTDDRDKAPVLTIHGSIDVNTLGKQQVTYECRDSSGNRATSLIWTVYIVPGEDRIAPVLTIRGGDSILVDGYIWRDPGADCVDGKDGILPVTHAGTVNSTAPGNYSRIYSCEDSAGNRSRAVRRVIVAKGTGLPSIKEAGMDTSDAAAPTNTGLTPLNGFSGTTGDKFISAIQFDLNGVDTAGLIAARAVFFTLGWDAETWNGDAFRVTFHFNRVTQPWSEGTGNWYYHDGGWKNGGEILFANYVMRPDLLERSTNPAVVSGVNKDNRAIFRPENVVSVGWPQEKTLSYDLAHSASGSLTRPVPVAADMVALELDLTEYVKTTPAAQDNGLLITVEGMPAGKSLRYATKELGDGSLAPRIYLTYNADTTTLQAPLSGR